MKYLTRANGQTFEVTVEDAGQVKVGDQAFSVNLKAIDEQVLFSLLIDHESYELVVDQYQDGFRVSLCGEMYEVAVEDLQRPRDRTRESRQAVSLDGEQVVRAPMPGLVVQVPISEGQEVAAGDVLIVLESMKMENELLSPRGGIVKTIHAAVGDTPSLDESLVTLQ
jgi:biotin carboxyl carrier protein